MQETKMTSAALRGSVLAALAFSAPGYIQVNYMDIKAKSSSQLRASTGYGYHIRCPLTLCLLYS
jgi:hypothetical protein